MTRNEWDQADHQKEDWIDEKQRLDICRQLKEALDEQQRVMTENKDIKAITHWTRQVAYFTQLLEKGDRGELSK